MARNPEFEDDDPAGELAPCGNGAFGTCCCTCVNLAKTIEKCTHLGGGGVCGGEPTGFACLVAFNVDGGPVITNWSEHGMCEMYLPRTKSDPAQPQA